MERAFEENADSIFDRPNKKSPDQVKLEEQEQLIESLYQQVGKLTVEKEFLKKSIFNCTAMPRNN